MKTILLIPICLVSIFSFGQQNTERFVAEISPVNVSLQTTFSANIQGKVSYRFNKYLSITARHNQELFSYINIRSNETPRNAVKKNSLSDISLGITLVNIPKPRIDPTDPTEKVHSWMNKQLQLDLGVCYYKFAASRTEFYSYDTDENGNYKVINSINRFSASLGFSFLLNKMSSEDRLKRQHRLSAGVYYGLNYDLQGYVKIAGENPSERAPKDYAFKRGGYYLRYNFRQQLTEHFFLGADLFFARMPYVEHRPNRDIYPSRGGEAEFRFQPYAGIILGWAF